ncbi:MAG: 50S ribosomal protein L15 [Nocardioidaceae bacterium]
MATTKKSTTRKSEPAAVEGHALKVHHLRPAPGARTAKTRVGRGEGSKGKTAGRGTKGTKARYQVSARFEGGQTPLHQRLPKLRGFTNPFRTEYQVVNLDRLAEVFPDGGTVGVDDLVTHGLVRSGHKVKVLGDGDIAVAVDVTAHRFSASAKDKIVAAGGSTTLA